MVIAQSFRIFLNILRQKYCSNKSGQEACNIFSTHQAFETYRNSWEFQDVQDFEDFQYFASFQYFKNSRLLKTYQDFQEF